MEQKDEKIREALICLVQEFYKQTSAFYKEVSVKDMLAWLEEQGEQKHKFNIGDIISNGTAVYCVDNIIKNSIGQDCYVLVNVEFVKNGIRYLILTNSQGKISNVEGLTWVCKQVDKSFEKQCWNKDKTAIKEKAQQIAWETSKHYDPLLSKERWCEMAALDMAAWLEKMK